MHVQDPAPFCSRHKAFAPQGEGAHGVGLSSTGSAKSFQNDFRKKTEQKRRKEWKKLKEKGVTIGKDAFARGNACDFPGGKTPKQPFLYVVGLLFFECLFIGVHI